MMGAGNVRLVYVYWRDLAGAPFRLLVYMALRARDNDPEPQFWAGREDLAFALGRIIPPVTDEESRRVRTTHFKAVKNAIGALLQAKAIATIQNPAPGRHAVYALNLTPERVPQTVPRTGPEDRTPYGSQKVGATGPEKWAQRVPVFGSTGPRNRTPEEEKEDTGLSRGGDSEGDHHRAGVAHTRASRKDDHQIAGAPIGITKSERDALHCGDPATRHAAASAILGRREDLGSPLIDRAQAEMPNADRSAVVVRAAQIFVKGFPG